MLKKTSTRRKLLQAISYPTAAAVIGGHLPNKWTKPIVQSVLLPAHAVTSGCEISHASLSGLWSISVQSVNNNVISYSTAFQLDANGNYTDTILGGQGTWSLNGNNIQLVSTGGDTLTGNISSSTCNSANGTGTIDTITVNWTANKS